MKRLILWPILTYIAFGLCGTSVGYGVPNSRLAPWRLGAVTGGIGGLIGFVVAASKNEYESINARIDSDRLELVRRFNEAHVMARSLRGWIRIVDRQPEQMDKVLVLKTDGSICVAQHRGKFFWTVPGGWRLWIDFWMPLPAPPVETPGGQ